jgi:hypothetical protein
MQVGELAAHRMNEFDECLRSVRDLGIVLDEHGADVLGGSSLRFAEVERCVEEAAGGCRKFLFSHESLLLLFSAWMALARSLFGRLLYSLGRRNSSA